MRPLLRREPEPQACRDSSREARGSLHGGHRRRRCTRRAGLRRRARLRAPLLAEDLLDALRNVAPATATGTRGEQSPPTTAGEMRLDRLARQLRDRQPPAPRFQAQLAIQLVGELDGRALHGMPAYHAATRSA